MKIVMINSCNFGSTGNIMLQIAETARLKNHEVITCCAKSRSTTKKHICNHIYIGNRFHNNLHSFLSKWTGYNGCFSILSTFIFLKKIDKIQPDYFHLHNLHNSYINLPMLFQYIRKNKIKTIWTLHDCWSFTGQCPYFDLVKCQKWKSGCYNCPQIDVYPASKVDKTKNMWILKKKWFTGIENLNIVTPSKWLADLVKQSFLNENHISVINNGIDLNIFHPVNSDFRKKHQIGEKFILLGVAFGWEKRKGLDIFIELAQRLDNRFQIVLVGTTDKVDCQLPSNIISIHRTSDQKELAQIYTAADLFVNPTREENYPTVNMESIACGTPVLTFRTGGSPEIPDEKTGYVVDVDDIDEMEKQIIRICTEKPFSKNDCIERAKSFDKIKKYNEYIELYK